MKIKKKIKEKNATFTIFSQQIINDKLLLTIIGGQKIIISMVGSN